MKRTRSSTSESSDNHTRTRQRRSSSRKRSVVDSGLADDTAAALAAAAATSPVPLTEPHRSPRARTPARTDTAHGEQEEQQTSRHTAVQIPIADMRIGDIISRTEYREITAIAPDLQSFSVRNLREEFNPNWTVRTSRPYQCYSASAFSETRRVGKTEMAQRFLEVGENVFTARFRTNFDKKKLAERLQEMHASIRSQPLDMNKRQYTALADTMMATGERTVVARMLSSESALGYSLVDVLNKSNDKGAHLINYCQINHRELLELTVRGVKYVCK